MKTFTAALASWLDRDWNPIVVKELRQAVRSRAVTSILVLFLLVLFGTMVVVLMSSEFRGHYRSGLGRNIFTALHVILGFACLLYIPVYLSARIVAERKAIEVDLIYVTTLSPARIIRGKLYCGLYLALLFFSACLPFMAVTNMARGIDLPTITVILGLLLAVTILTLQAAIFLSLLPVTKELRNGLTTLPMIVSCIAFGTVVGAGESMIRSGIGSELGTAKFWGYTLTFLTFMGIAGGELYLASVALISPPSANRALPLRIFTTLAWLLGAATAWIWAFVTGDSDVLIGWCAITGIILAGLLIITLCGKDERSLRVNRTIPAGGPKQRLAFLFYNGAAGGLAWLLLLAVLTPLVFLAGLPATRASSLSSSDEQALWAMLGVFLYILSYALTALIIHRTFFPRRPTVLVGILTLLLPGLLLIVPNLVLFFTRGMSWDVTDDLQYGNLFNIFTRDQYAANHVVFAGFWSLVMLVLNAKWFARQVRAFQPPPPEAAPPPLTPAPAAPPLAPPPPPAAS